MALCIVHAQKDQAKWAIVVEDRFEAIHAVEEYLEKDHRLKGDQYDLIHSLEKVDTIEIWGYKFSVADVNTLLEVTSMSLL